MPSFDVKKTYKAASEFIMYVSEFGYIQMPLFDVLSKETTYRAAFVFYMHVSEFI